MNRKNPVQADERMVKLIFWIIIALVVLIILCIVGGWIWFMWLITTVVAS
jgi:hypothetical protein